ncbi:MAG: helix-turn-helix transcriptional regulator [Rhodoplanes sp.]
MAISVHDTLLDENECLLDENQAAAELRVKPTTLRKWRCVGGGPEYVKVGRLARYQPSALRKYKRARTRRSTSDAGAA